MKGKHLLPLWLLPAFLGLSSPGHAQTTDRTYRYYSTDEGLCDNQVIALQQDSRGFLWIGTGEGLSRFDGAEFRNYQRGKSNHSSFLSNNVNRLLEYQPGKLLISSVNRIWCLDLNTYRFYPPPAPFRDRDVFSVELLSDNQMLVLTHDSVLLTDTGFRIRRGWPLPFRTAGAIGWQGRQVGRDTVLLTNAREHWLLHLSAGRFIPYRPELSLPASRDLLYLHRFDPVTGSLFFSNYWYGLWELSLSGKILHHFRAGAGQSGLPTNHIGSVLPVGDSLLYIGTMSGLTRFNRKSRRILDGTPAIQTATPFFNKPILSLCLDKDGHIWIGTTSGLYLEVPSLGRRLFDGDAIATQVQADWSQMIRGPDGELYAGSQYQGLWQIRSGQSRRLASVPLHMIWILQRYQQKIRIGGAGPSLFLYDPYDQQAERIRSLEPFYGEGDILTLYYRDRRGDEWYSINQGGGLVRKPAGQERYYHYHRGQNPAPFQLGYVAMAAEEAGGGLWFAVNKANTLLHWDHRLEKFSELPLAQLKGLQGQLPGGIQAILGGEDSLLWISSEAGGLIAYHTGRKQARLYTVEDGLPTTYIYSIARDDRNRIWMGTAKGLVCFLPEEQRFVTFRQQQGLPDENFSSGALLFDSVSHTLIAGSGNKIIQADPDQLLRKEHNAVRIYLDEIRVNALPVPDHRDIQASYAENNLQLRFTGIDLFNGTELEYSYRLTGADQDWIIAGDQKTALYHQLPPGKYGFEVRARYKGESRWSSAERLISIEIHKAWWQTWLFQLALLTVAAVVAYWLIRQYLQRKLRRQRLALEQELAVEQERIRLARELHDGLGSQLSGVKHSFSALRNRLHLPQETGQVFDSTLDKLNDSINELRNVSHSMLSSEFLEEGLESALRNYCAALAGKGPLQVRVQSLIREPLTLGAEKSFHLFRIVQELLQNILKHADATEVLVQLSFHEQTLHITVEDNGRGFTPSVTEWKRGMGWHNVENRIKQVGGKADIRSAPGQGTTAELEVPVSD